MSKDCPSEETLLELLADTLTPEVSSEIEDHAAKCDSCSAVLAELARSSGTPVSSSNATLPDVPLAAGARIDRYIVLRRVGAGGMGLVYEAYDPKLERKVAVKVLRPSDETGERPGVGLEARLVREAQAMARLSHAHVVAVHDVGSVGDRIYIAMELIEGTTLRAWIGESKHDTRAVLAMMMGAGEGLAAAHRAGVIHRDFKPENVLIGPDGRARVTDFGLARLEATATIPKLDPADAASTLTGTVLGTPAYMAPELFVGKPADERSDQWSYCVTLHEALLGRRPSTDAKRTLDLAGLPAYVRAVLARGLSRIPEGRFASMDELLAALHQDPARSWRRRALGGVLLATLVAATAGYATSAKRHDQLCQGAPARFAGVWDDARRDQVRSVYASSGLAYANDSWERARGALDKYSQDWVAMHTDACLATRVRGEQPDSVLTVRMACLDRRLGEMGAVADVLSHADASVIARSAEVLTALAPISACADTQALMQHVRPPDDPALRKRTDDLATRVAEVRALTDAGKYKDALGKAKLVADEARETGHAPTIADSLNALAVLQEEDGDLKGAEATLRDAFWTAEGAGHDEGAARASIELVYLMGAINHKVDDGKEWGRHAGAIVKRLGDSPAFVAPLLQNLGTTTFADGDAAGARDLFRKVVGIREKIQPDSVALSSTLTNLAIAYRADFFFDEAIEHDRRAIAVLERAAGPMHPDLISMHVSVCDALTNMTRYDEARVECDRGLVILNATVGPTHRDACALSMAFGRLAGAAGHYKEALPHYQAAAKCFEGALGPEHPFTADAIGMEGEAEGRLGNYAASLEKLRRAVALLEKTYGEDDEQLCDTLLPLGEMLLEHKENVEARKVFERVLAIYEKVTEPNRFQQAYPHLEIGALDFKEKRVAKAIEHYEIALKLLEGFGHDPRGKASVELSLAHALVASKGDLVRARKLAEDAAKFYEKTPDHPDAAEVRDLLKGELASK